MFSERLTSRYGKFAISQTLIEQEPELVQLIMSKVIVLKAECEYIHRSISYEAWSPEFDELRDFDVVPIYTLNITRNFLEPVKIVFKRGDNDELSKACVETGSESSEFHVPENRSKFGSMPRA